MLPILLKSGTFVFLIALGYFLKAIGFFGKDDYKIPVKIILNITLPCSVLVSFSVYRPDLSMLTIIGLGLGMNCLMLCIGFLFSRHKPRSTRAVWINCSPSYNIAAFVLPFVQSFLPPASLVAASLFDVGNALMCNGTTYALSKNILDGTKGLNLKRIGNTLLHSVPFMTYVLMLVITVFQIPIPQVVADFAAPMANANPFLAMLMVGMMLDLRLDTSRLKDIFGIVGLRFAAGVAASLVFYFLLPMPLEIRQVLSLLVFAPVSMVTTALTPSAGGDPTIVACVNSITILICVPTVLTLLTIFGAL